MLLILNAFPRPDYDYSNTDYDDSQLGELSLC